MGCRSGYMESSIFEKEIKNTLELLIYVFQKRHIAIDSWFSKQMSERYFNRVSGDRIVSALCGILKDLDTPTREELVYGNSRDKMCRRLADWWEKHQEADQVRENQELRKDAIKEKEQMKKQALEKLTGEERDLLGLT